MSPSNDSVTRHPPSLHRVVSGRLPRLHRYYRDAPTPCRPSRRAWFPSLGGTAFALVFAPAASSASPRAKERLFLRRPTPEILRQRRQDLLGSWKTPMPACPALRPRQDLHARPLRRLGVAFRQYATATAPAFGLSRLNHAAYELAVYASQHGSPRNHARLASGRWPTFAGQD